LVAIEPTTLPICWEYWCTITAVPSRIMPSLRHASHAYNTTSPQRMPLLSRSMAHHFASLTTMPRRRGAKTVVSRAATVERVAAWSRRVRTVEILPRQSISSAL
jgi:hypothetical protein